jgi:hypothetical protein
MNLIKKILLDDWRPKLVCLILASVLWYLIRQNLPASPPGRDSRANPNWTSPSRK